MHASPSPGSAGGLRRVDWVALSVDGDHLTAEASGVAHRLPRTVAIPVREAARLVAAGVPLVVRRCGSAARSAI